MTHNICGLNAHCLQAVDHRDLDGGSQGLCELSSSKLARFGWFQQLFCYMVSSKHINDEWICYLLLTNSEGIGKLEEFDPSPRCPLGTASRTKEGHGPSEAIEHPGR